MAIDPELKRLRRNTDRALRNLPPKAQTEEQEQEQSQREIAHIDQRTQDYHEWRNRD